MSDESSNSGRDDARKDIAAGRLRYFLGTRHPWADFCHELMRTRFGIEVESTSCLTNNELENYRHEYNAVIEAHVDQQFGKCAIARAWKEVEQYRKQLYGRLPDE